MSGRSLFRLLKVPSLFSFKRPHIVIISPHVKIRNAVSGVGLHKMLCLLYWFRDVNSLWVFNPERVPKGHSGMAAGFFSTPQAFILSIFSNWFIKKKPKTHALPPPACIKRQFLEGR